MEEYHKQNKGRQLRLEPIERVELFKSFVNLVPLKSLLRWTLCVACYMHRTSKGTLVDSTRKPISLLVAGRKEFQMCNAESFRSGELADDFKPRSKVGSSQSILKRNDKVEVLHCQEWLCATVVEESCGMIKVEYVFDSIHWQHFVYRHGSEWRFVSDEQAALKMKPYASQSEDSQKFSLSIFDPCGQGILRRQDGSQLPELNDNSHDENDEVQMINQDDKIILSKYCQDIAKEEVEITPLKRNSLYLQCWCIFDGAQNFAVQKEHDWVFSNEKCERYSIKQGRYDTETNAQGFLVQSCEDTSNHISVRVNIQGFETRKDQIFINLVWASEEKMHILDFFNQLFFTKEKIRFRVISSLSSANDYVFSRYTKVDLNMICRIIQTNSSLKVRSRLKDKANIDITNLLHQHSSASKYRPAVVIHKNGLVQYEFVSNLLYARNSVIRWLAENCSDAFTKKSQNQSLSISVGQSERSLKKYMPKMIICGECDMNGWKWEAENVRSAHLSIRSHGAESILLNDCDLNANKINRNLESVEPSNLFQEKERFKCKISQNEAASFILKEMRATKQEMQIRESHKAVLTRNLEDILHTQSIGSANEY
uniref:Uncharacterized protein n=1 Tax=Hanusia phi TaxID=3032 RepID=A0A7S0E364_9CRYP|mmetsp:Transcript_13689/g.31556  ORF Transcript_13689/g.31556 Transcript_13689/m.31556 type:complete len:597 (+) Transcript_13689:1173-2963(+)